MEVRVKGGDLNPLINSIPAQPGKDGKQPKFELYKEVEKPKEAPKNKQGNSEQQTLLETPRQRAIVTAPISTPAAGVNPVFLLAAFLPLIGLLPSAFSNNNADNEPPAPISTSSLSLSQARTLHPDLAGKADGGNQDAQRKLLTIAATQVAPVLETRITAAFFAGFYVLFMSLSFVAGLGPLGHFAAAPLSALLANTAFVLLHWKGVYRVTEDRALPQPEELTLSNFGSLFVEGSQFHIPLFISGWFLPPLILWSYSYAQRKHRESNERVLNERRGVAGTTASPDLLARNLAAIIRSIQTGGDRARQEEALQKLVDLAGPERLGIDHYTLEHAVDTDPVSVIDAVFVRQKLLGRTLSAQPLDDAIANWDGRPQTALRDSMKINLVPKAAGPEEVARETRSVTALARAKEDGSTKDFTVLLTGPNDTEKHAEALSGLPGIHVVRASKLKNGDDIRKNLLQINGTRPGKIQILLHEGVVLPPLILATLTAFNHQEEDRALVEVLILETLGSDLLAVKARLSDVNDMLDFRQAVLSQA